MLINGQSTTAETKTPPTYSIVLYKQPQFDFSCQDAFFTEELGKTSKTTEEINRNSESEGDATKEVEDAEEAAGAENAEDGEDGEDGEDTDKVEEADVKKRITKKSQQEHLKKRKSELINAAGKIYIFGLKCKEEINQQAFNAAIPGLAMILGTYRAYFDDADDEECKEFTKTLVQRCRVDLGKNSLSKTDKRTTPFHLLSRLFRNSERRQASADAKILKLAHKEGETQKSFESWVKGYGSLSTILRKVRDEAPDTEDKPSEKKRKEKPFTVWEKAAEITEDDAAGALEALKKLADGKRYTTTISYHHGRFDVMRLIEQPSAAAAGRENNEGE
jgi:hypothetical protein